MKTFKVRFPVSISTEGEYYQLFNHFVSIDIEAEDVKEAMSKIDLLLSARVKAHEVQP